MGASQLFIFIVILLNIFVISEILNSVTSDFNTEFVELRLWNETKSLELLAEILKVFLKMLYFLLH